MVRVASLKDMVHAGYKKPDIAGMTAQEQLDKISVRIVNEVKGDDYPVTERAIDVQMVSIRRKLGTHGDLIETVRGVGYRFVQD